MDNTPRPDATPHGELDALSLIYARAIARFEEGHAKKEGGAETAPDARKEINGSGETIIPK
jgi:hypothetical protein